MQPSRLLLSLALVLLLSAATIAAQPTYTVTDLGALHVSFLAVKAEQTGFERSGPLSTYTAQR